MNVENRVWHICIQEMKALLWLAGARECVVF